MTNTTLCRWKTYTRIISYNYIKKRPVQKTGNFGYQKKRRPVPAETIWRRPPPPPFGPPRRSVRTPWNRCPLRIWSAAKAGRRRLVGTSQRSPQASYFQKKRIQKAQVPRQQVPGKKKKKSVQPPWRRVPFWFFPPRRWERSLAALPLGAAGLKECRSVSPQKSCRLKLRNSRSIWPPARPPSTPGPSGRPFMYVVDIIHFTSLKVQCNMWPWERAGLLPD